MAEGAGFENRCALCGYRGFESRPLRCAAHFGVDGIRAPKGCGKRIFPRRRGDTSEARPEGRSPHGNPPTADLGSNPALSGLYVFEGKSANLALRVGG